ncbi:MAG: sensor histidine kinase [Anaerovoracaceae bacterium]
MRFIQYVISKKYSVLAALLMEGVFFIVALLYGLKAGPFLYAVILSFFFGLIFLIVGFVRYTERQRTVKSIRSSLPYISESFPHVVDGLEEEYQKIAEDLMAILSENNVKFHKERTEMTQYYTMWVHQIKTPIAAMSLLIHNHDFSGKEEMSMELLRIEEYVDMLLQYIRLGSDKTDFLFRKQQLDTIIKDAIKRYATVFIGRNIGLHYTPMDDSVMTDKKWLTFVISQVISNSLKYTKEGSISISFNAQNGILTIEDTGIGIRPEDLPRIFDQGYTGYNGRLDNHSTGIGLHLCKKIVDKLGHKISARSNPGEGTKIYIDLSYENVRYE